jgi:hypothetical protein
VPQAPSSTGGGTTGGSVPPPPSTTPPPPSNTPPPPVLTGPGAGSNPHNAIGDNDPGGGDNCVSVDSLLPGGVLAGDAKEGDHFACHLPESGFHDAPLRKKGQAVREHAVEIHAGDAVLRVSSNTPFTLTSASKDLEDGHWRRARDMLDQGVWVLTRDGVESRTVDRVIDLGLCWVQPLDFGGRSFAAGDNPAALIFSHNIMKGSQASYVPSSGGDYTWGTEGASLGGFSPLTGSVQQGQSTIAQNNATIGAGNPYTVQGGYLGSGSYEGMGQGLADAGYPANPATAGFGLPPPAPSPSSPSPYAGGAFGNSGYTGSDTNYTPTTPVSSSTPAPAHHNNILDNKFFKLATLLLGGPAAGLALKGVNYDRHRND